MQPDAQDDMQPNAQDDMQPNYMTCNPTIFDMVYQFPVASIPS